MNSFIKPFKSLFKLRAKIFQCPACHYSLLLKSGDDETSVRCLRCRGTTIHLSLLNVIKDVVFIPETKTAYELSSRGPIVRYLKQHFAAVQTSEYYDNFPIGGFINSVRCEDVQKLTFPKKSFDVCTSTEVFEHVPDDYAGFREIRRVLKANGYFIFTVPLSDSQKTVKRAHLDDQGIKYLLPVKYHSDRISGPGKVLVYRDYGYDITERLLSAGFREAWIIDPSQSFFGYSRKVVIAKV